MRRMSALLLVAWLGVFAGCSTGKPRRESIGILFLLGSELLSKTPGDTRASALADGFSAKVEKLKHETTDPAERDLLILYSRALDSYRLAIQRRQAEITQAPFRGSAQGSTSSDELWKRAAGQLKEAQVRFAAARGMQTIEYPVYMDPPMPKKHPF